MRPDTRSPVCAHRASPPPCRRFGTVLLATKRHPASAASAFTRVRPDIRLPSAPIGHRLRRAGGSAPSSLRRNATPHLRLPHSPACGRTSASRPRPSGIASAVQAVRHRPPCDETPPRICGFRIHPHAAGHPASRPHPSGTASAVQAVRRTVPSRRIASPERLRVHPAAGAGRQTLQSTLSRYVVPRQTSDPRALCTPDPAETACVSRTSSRRGRPRSTRRTTPASSETYRLRRPPPRSERTRTARGPSPAFIPGRPPYRTFRPQSGRPSPRARPRRSAPPAEVSPR